jgi:hypothetical protein
MSTPLPLNVRTGVSKGTRSLGLLLLWERSPGRGETPLFRLRERSPAVLGSGQEESGECRRPFPRMPGLPAP